MMHAVHTIDGVDGPDFSRAVAANDYTQAEEVLLRKCPVKYPTSAEVYADWKEQLSASEPKDATAGLRITSCDRRLEAPDRGGEKTLEALLLGKVRGLPIYCQTANGMFRYYIAWRYLPGGEEEQRLRADMIRTDRDVRLSELAANGDAFRCPLAEFNLCAAAEPQCKEGITDLNLLPAPEQCSVRESLREAGWLLKERVQ